MKKLWFFIITLIIGLTALSQQVELDKFSFSANFRSLPREPQDPSYKTYTVFLKCGPLMRSLNNPTELAGRINISGWRFIPIDAHLRVSIYMEDVTIESQENNTKIQILKDNAGKDIGKKITSQTEVFYTYSARILITDFKGNLIREDTIVTRQKKNSYLCPITNSEAEANAYIRFGNLKLLNELNLLAFTQLAQSLSEDLTYSYGYPERTINDILLVINSENHPAYEGFKQAWINVSLSMMNMSANEPIDSVRSKLQPTIDYFTQIKNSYVSGDKANRKIRYACHYNLSKIYYYLDEPELASQEASELIINKYGAKDGKILEAMANDLKLKMNQSKMNTRHFHVDVENYKGPEVVSRN